MRQEFFDATCRICTAPPPSIQIKFASVHVSALLGGHEHPWSFQDAQDGFTGHVWTPLWRDNQDEKAATIRMRIRGVAVWDNQVVGSGSQAPSCTSVSV